MEKKKTEISDHKTTLSNIKQYASEFHTYLAIKQIETKVTIEERFVETFARSENLEQILLSLKDETAFRKISSFKSFGQIEVEMRPSEVVMTKLKGQQAQLEVVSSSARIFEDKNINFKQTINTGLTNTTSCLILTAGRLVLSCRSTNHVNFFNSDGSNDFEIVLKPCNVMDITFIPEDNTIAATSGGEGIRSINIIDVKDRKICRKHSVKSLYYGIVYNDAKLIACARFIGLHILKSGSSEVIEEVKITKMSLCSYVAAFDNKLYYTNNNHHSVTCCDTKGAEFWTFKDENVLTDPKGITVDNDGNVYVANPFSHEVFVISSDGKRCFELLSSKDGLRFPNVLDFDRSSNQLLVANERDTALLFHVTGKN